MILRVLLPSESYLHIGPHKAAQRDVPGKIRQILVHKPGKKGLKNCGDCFFIFPKAQVLHPALSPQKCDFWSISDITAVRDTVLSFPASYFLLLETIVVTAKHGWLLRMLESHTPIFCLGRTSLYPYLFFLNFGGCRKEAAGSSLETALAAAIYAL